MDCPKCAHSRPWPAYKDPVLLVCAHPKAVRVYEGELAALEIVRAKGGLCQDGGLFEAKGK